MLSICVSYPPEGVVPIECDELRRLRRDAHDDSLFLQRSPEGEWIISVKLPDGKIVDVAEAGSGNCPKITEGLIASLRSMVRAGESGVLRKRIQKERSMAQKHEKLALMRQNLEYAELLGRMQRRAPHNTRDHPRFGVAR